MFLKYKNKEYSSEDLPVLLFFKTMSKKREFINELSNYNDFNNYIKISSVHVALAGNIVIKDKRSTLYFKIDNIQEKKYLQKQIFDSIEDSNTVISTPLDINFKVIEQWIEKNIVYLAA